MYHSVVKKGPLWIVHPPPPHPSLALISFWGIKLIASSPGSPIFSTLHEKEGEPGKTYHMRDIRWNQLPYMAQWQVGQNQGDRCRKFEFFDWCVTIGYESASEDASAPLLQVENCDLHDGNLIVSTPRWLWWSRLGHEHDRVTVQIAVFDTQLSDWRASACWFIMFRSKSLSFRWEIPSLELANSLLCHIWKLVPPDVTHVIGFTRLPLFSHTTLKRSESLGTRLIKLTWKSAHLVPT